MEWQDEGLVLGTRKHGETGVILELMTREHGRHLGIVRGGRSSRLRPILQPGNSVLVTWRARLEEHLGAYSVEPDSLRAAQLMNSQLGVFGIQTLGCHLRLLAEREPHAGLYAAALVILEHVQQPEIAAPLLVRFEIALLNELGFGLDLSRCADTGRTKNLVYVSPKSGRAVSLESGKPWHDKMLKLPIFLQPDYQQREIESISGRQVAAEDNDIQSAFQLTSYFLDRNVYLPRNLTAPDERTGLIKTILKQI